MKSLPTYCHYLRRDFQVAQNLITLFILLQVLLHPQICMAVVFKVGIRKTGLGVMIISHGKGDILHSYFLQNRAYNKMLTYIYSFQEKGEFQHN